MEKIQKNEINNSFNLSLLININKNTQGISYENYLTQNKINNQNQTNNNALNHNKNQNKPHFSMNMNSLYFNMLRYNFFNNNLPYNTNTRISSLLVDFNNELKSEYDKENKNYKVEIKNNPEKKINTEYDFTPLIKKLESQEDERFSKSRFLNFIKDINSNKLIINEEKNIIEENPNYINNKNNENKNDINNQNEKNELEELLNEAKKYMDYSREDLALNILEKIMDDSLIKLEKNKNYLLKAYIYLIICHLNSNEELLGISFIIDLLNLIKEENNESSIEYNKKYLEKEFIEKINRRDFDICNKEEYEQYEYNKNKIKEETENFIKNKIMNNNNEIYNETLLLLYGLILYLNEKYTEAEEAFGQLIILNEQNYFYYNILGVININQNKYEDAIKYYKKALEINNKYPKCLLNYSVLLSNQGKYEESCRYIISALKIFEDIPEGWTQLLSNVIELNKDELICEINDRNLSNIEKDLFKK